MSFVETMVKFVEPSGLSWPLEGPHRFKSGLSPQIPSTAGFITGIFGEPRPPTWSSVKVHPAWPCPTWHRYLDAEK